MRNNRSEWYANNTMRGYRQNYTPQPQQARWAPWLRMLAVVVAAAALGVALALHM